MQLSGGNGPTRRERPLSEHRATVEWERRGADVGTRYDRSHLWRFDAGVEVSASAAPGLHGDPSRVDPEEAFVASISSCHMLWFLHLAADAGKVVDRYIDDAVGTMTRDDTGTTWITHVDLRPTIDWSGDVPTPDEVEALRHEGSPALFHSQLGSDGHHRARALTIASAATPSAAQ